MGSGPGLQPLTAVDKTIAPARKMGESQVSMVQMGKAMGDPVRWRILQELSRSGTLTCTQVLERFPLSQPSISRHLKILVDAGWVSMQAKGPHHYFTLRPEALRHLRQAIAHLGSQKRQVSNRNVRRRENHGIQK